MAILVNRVQLERARVQAPPPRNGECAVKVASAEVAWRPDPGRHDRPNQRGQLGRPAARVLHRLGQMADVHSRQVLTIAGRAPAPVTLTESPRSTVVHGVRIQLDGHVRVGGRSDLR